MEDFFMKIYVLNARPIKKAVSFLLVLIISVAFTLGTLWAVDAYAFPSVPTDSKPSENKISKVIIDAGHGGEDPGAVAADGTLEKDINLAIALLIGEELKSRGYEVVYTRTEDKMLYSEAENVKGMRKLSDLKGRAAIAKENPEALFVSIHMNSFGASKYSGLQVYHQDKSEDSLSLANSIQGKVRELVQKDNTRVTKNGKNLYLLDNNGNTSVIVECGFLTNPEESRKLSEKEYQKQLSFAIVCGIIEYIEAKSK